MGRIIYLCGKSSSGKNTVLKELLRDESLKLGTIVPYTTRPARSCEKNGREYFFVDENEYQHFLAEGKVIEHREYNSYHGLWRYFTVDDGQIDLWRDYVLIGTLEGYVMMRNYFGEEHVLAILLELDDGERLQRALDRERAQTIPCYEEMCRRFIADSEDFSEEKIKEAGICHRFMNDDLERCLVQVKDLIRGR